MYKDGTPLAPVIVLTLVISRVVLIIAPLVPVFCFVFVGVGAGRRGGKPRRPRR